MLNGIRIQFVVQTIKDKYLSVYRDGVADLLDVYPGYRKDMLEGTMAVTHLNVLQKSGTPSKITEEPYPDAEYNVIAYNRDQREPETPKPNIDSTDIVERISAIASDEGYDTISVMGGRDTFEVLLPHADAIHWFHAPLNPDEFPNKDHVTESKFPDWDRSNWVHAYPEKHDLDQTYMTNPPPDHFVNFYKRLEYPTNPSP